jgi:hypothetical protein
MDPLDKESRMMTALTKPAADTKPFSFTASGPVPRTDADRKHRRKHKARSWKGLRGEVSEMQIEALLGARPQLRAEDRSVVQGLAHIISIAEVRLA